MDRTRSDDYKGVFYSLLLAAGAILMAPYFPLATVLVPLALAYALAGGGYLLGGLAAALCLFVGYLINPPLCALLAAAFLPPALAAGVVIRARLRFRHSVLAVSAAALAGAALSAGVLWLITGQGPVDYLSSLFVRLLSELGVLGEDPIRAFYQLFRYPDVVSGAITQSAVDAAPIDASIAIMGGMCRDFLNLHLVGYIIIYALLTGLLCVTIPRALAKRRGAPVADVPAFSEFALPRRFWAAFLVSYIAAFIGASSGWQRFDIAEITIYGVYSFVFAVQGLCFLDHLYKKRSMGTGARMTLHVLAMLFLGGEIPVFLGIIENMAGLRARLAQKGGTV